MEGNILKCFYMQHVEEKRKINSLQNTRKGPTTMWRKHLEK